MFTAVFDIDEVLLNMSTKFAEIIFSKYNFKITDSCWRFYDYKKNPLLSEEIKKEITDLIINKFFLLSLRPFPGATFALKKIKENGGKIIIASSRDKSLEETTIASLKKNSLLFDDIFFGDDKHLVVNEVKPYIFVDDRFLHHKNILQNGGHKPKVMLINHRPWNQGKKDEQITRVYNWQGSKNLPGIADFL